MEFYLETIPWLKELEGKTDSIVQEWRSLPPEFMLPWPQPNRDFMHVIMLACHGRFSPVEELCPTIMGIARRVPNLRSLLIQTIDPGSHLTPHRGATAGICRVHLGPDVQEGNWIKVNGKKTYFKTGECFCFR